MSRRCFLSRIIMFSTLRIKIKLYSRFHIFTGMLIFILVCFLWLESYSSQGCLTMNCRDFYYYFLFWIPSVDDPQLRVNHTSLTFYIHSSRSAEFNGVINIWKILVVIEKSLENAPLAGSATIPPAALNKWKKQVIQQRCFCKSSSFLNYEIIFENTSFPEKSQWEKSVLVLKRIFMRFIEHSQLIHMTRRLVLSLRSWSE